MALYFLRLGILGFGGPITLAGYMPRDLVDKRRRYSALIDEIRRSSAQLNQVARTNRLKSLLLEMRSARI